MKRSKTPPRKNRRIKKNNFCLTKFLKILFFLFIFINFYDLIMYFVKQFIF